ncbi:hypothetical protein Poli38472_009639 [Pythium oligandrum]|uniref:dCTP pyrophosphatase 1 n=1 Tax=Pythium oligandrum TaxID=41045 RepID=A0A8K1FGY7_PYTOL|nr:hypothetical protein Poli38472_009639 [Pythium oligandrum]|eukprot:TMW62146.1 hypothetical protein Poli38472_009639 [Pythium oligandrum]
MDHALEMKAATAMVDDASADAHAHAHEPPLFEEYYEDWAAFDHAVTTAIEKHHPIRKRSSLTFEVYNRTVSKGRHDRKAIAEFLSKTFKCTHGIKFRSRGTGKRLRHKLRDIGCPFHIYATAIEYGGTYRVKVRLQDKHNHPIGPDAMKAIGALHDPDYDLDTDSDTHSTIDATVEGSTDGVTSPTTADLHAQAQAYAHAHAHAQAAQLHGHANAADILDAGVHEGESLLDGAIDSHIGEFTAAAAEAAAAAVASSSANRMLGSLPSKFEETTTLEDLRRKIAQFASEREWDQFHTPRNLTLALAGEMGELCECFQWKGDDKPVDQWTTEERVHLGEEMSDVLIYLIRLADKCNVDLPAAVHDKMIKNARKYPADMVKGSAKKYNEYKRLRLDKEASL